MDVVHLLVNPAARRGRASKTAALVGRLVSDSGYEVRWVRPDSPEDVSTEIRRIQDEVERLLIIGGDGLIHRALPALVSSGLTVGLIPSGTGNDFARALGVPTSAKKAVPVALGPPKSVDLIRCGDKWAASVVTGGWSGAINSRAEGLRFPRGQQRYTVATLLELAGGVSHSALQVEIDGVVYDDQASLVAVGNTQYFGGGMKVCPGTSFDDGKLQVAVLQPVNVAQLLPIIPKIFTGKHVHHPRIETWTASSVRVASKVPLWADGEPFGDAGEALLEVVPAALSVAVG